MIAVGLYITHLLVITHNDCTLRVVGFAFCSAHFWTTLHLRWNGWRIRDIQVLGRCLHVPSRPPLSQWWDHLGNIIVPLAPIILVVVPIILLFRTAPLDYVPHRLLFVLVDSLILSIRKLARRCLRLRNLEFYRSDISALEGRTELRDLLKDPSPSCRVRLLSCRLTLNLLCFCLRFFFLLRHLLR
jgi:hypothetical protein